MNNFTIAVIGTGVIGTSIGLALKQQENAPRLVAHDKDLTIAQGAVKQGAFDKAEWNLINACEPADLIVLSMPLNGLKLTFEAIAPYLKDGVIITDTTRNATKVMALAEELLPPQAHFVSGNPLVHPLDTGYLQAQPTLFKDRPYCLTPSSTVPETAVETVIGLVQSLGAEPFFLEAAEHDGLVVTVEALPKLFSLTLMQTLIQENSWREARKFAGQLFEQTSAGATGDPDDLYETLAANRELLLTWTERAMRHLHNIREQLINGEASQEELTQQFDQAVVERINWLKDYQAGQFIDPGTPPLTIEKPSLMKKWFGIGR